MRDDPPAQSIYIRTSFRVVTERNYRSVENHTMNANWIVNPDFGYFGWTSPVQKNRKGTSRITINKLVATGIGLETGRRLYCYVAQDKEKRPLMVVYLDGKPRKEGES